MSEWEETESGIAVPSRREFGLMLPEWIAVRLAWERAVDERQRRWIRRTLIDAALLFSAAILQVVGVKLALHHYAETAWFTPFFVGSMLYLVPWMRRAWRD